MGEATASAGRALRDAGRGARARVVTMTPSPAVDRVYMVDTMVAGEVNRARRVQTFLSGKGINVARNLRGAGGRALAVTALSDEERHLVGDDDLYRIVTASRSARVNTVVISASGATTNVNEHPHPLTQEEWERMCAVADAAVRERDADWLVVAGSIPTRAGAVPGMLSPAGLADAARTSGARLCLDSGGSSLRSWLAAGFMPDLVKPNASELAGAVGRPLVTVRDAVDAARELVDRGASAVLASLGGDGALLVTADRALWARPPRVDVVNTTGAGDAALAGFIADFVGDPGETELVAALRRAVAWGSLAVRELDTVPSSHRDVEGIEIDDPPLRLHLTTDH